MNEHNHNTRQLYKTEGGTTYTPSGLRNFLHLQTPVGIHTQYVADATTVWNSAVCRMALLTTHKVQSMTTVATGFLS